MAFLTGWFKKREPEDFEQVLSNLADDIQKRQTHLADIRLHERRLTLLVTLYTVGAWVAYVSVWYANPNLLPAVTRGGRESAVERFVKGAPVVVGPFVILLVRRIVQLVYGRFANSDEKHLQFLRKQQREKIEEFKKKTKYYETRKVIERFDDSPPTAPGDSPIRKPSPSGGSSPVVTPKRGPGAGRGPPTLAAIHTPAPGQKVPGHLMPTPQTPMPPPRKQWYDKVADAILGDDEASGAGAASRYALICQKCFAHNGLVTESMWEDTQYVCPKCGHFNPSARSIKNGTAPTSPLSAMRTPMTPARGGPNALPFHPSAPGARVTVANGGPGVGPPVGFAPFVVPSSAVGDAGREGSAERGRSQEPQEAAGARMEVDS